MKYLKLHVKQQYLKNRNKISVLWTHAFKILELSVCTSHQSIIIIIRFIYCILQELWPIPFPGNSINPKICKGLNSYVIIKAVIKVGTERTKLGPPLGTKLKQQALSISYTQETLYYLSPFHQTPQLGRVTIFSWSWQIYPLIYNHIGIK